MHADCGEKLHGGVEPRWLYLGDAWRVVVAIGEVDPDCPVWTHHRRPDTINRKIVEFLVPYSLLAARNAGNPGGRDARRTSTRSVP